MEDESRARLRRAIEHAFQQAAEDSRVDDTQELEEYVIDNLERTLSRIWREGYEAGLEYWDAYDYAVANDQRPPNMPEDPYRWTDA